MGRYQVQQEVGLNISISLSTKETIKNSWQMAVLVFGKHSGPIPADDMAPQVITGCRNSTLDFI